MTSLLHRQRLVAVMAALREADARSVIDLGCGDGELLALLAQDPRFRRITGLDLSADAILGAGRRLEREAGTGAAPVRLRQGSVLGPFAGDTNYDAGVLVETIEHIDPGDLSRLERSVFRELAPRTVVVTTPNSEYNSVLGVPPNRFRNADHRFEWDRQKFEAWCTGVAGRAGYTATFRDLPFTRQGYGGPSQMAIFTVSAGARDAVG